jgi:hypothetical protein
LAGEHRGSQGATLVEERGLGAELEARHGLGLDRSGLQIAQVDRARLETVRQLAVGQAVGADLPFQRKAARHA